MDLIGGSYKGDSVDGIPHGEGEMEMGNGNIYKGGFHMGQFHGHGSLKLKTGSCYFGEWRYGKEISGNVVFEDGLQHKQKNWDYCTATDRRFQSERLGGG